MPISMNLKQLKTTLLKKSLYDFMQEFWDTYEPFELQTHWIMEFLCECFMFSMKHFLPAYIWQDWISDKKYLELKLKTGGHCPVRDSVYGESYVHNHDWNMPPRHSKSSILNVAGPVWVSTIAPLTVASVSHTSGLSVEMNEKRKKILESDKFKYYFGNDPKLRLIRSSASDIQLAGGAKLYSTPMASFTGHGADCFVAGTRVNTPYGYKNIEDIVKGDVVLSYNHSTDKVEHCIVQATRRIKRNDSLRIVTSDGRAVESTVDHRFWNVNRGYCRIDEFEEDGKFLKISQSKPTMPCMWTAYILYKRCLQEVFRKIVQLSASIDVQLLQKTIYDAIIGFYKVNRTKLNWKFLFTALLEQGNERQKTGKQTLSNLWKNIANRWTQILFKGMLEYCETHKSSTNDTKKDESMSYLQKDICIRFIQQVLQPSMCGQGSFAKNDGNRKFKLQNRKRISYTIYKNKRENITTGQTHLSDVWETVGIQNCSSRTINKSLTKFNSSSYRWKQEKQFREQFNNILQNLSYTTTSTTIKTKEYVKQRKFVYDIQVSDNHNFFVEDILVHNCIIADDLVSSDNAKRDQKIMKNAIVFSRATLPTRLNNKNTGVIWHIQQRLGNGDVSGTILDDPELRKVYSHTELKALADKDEVFIFPCSGKIVTVTTGQPLWQERFGDYTSIRAEVGEADFETQYNQNPAASLNNIIKENYINWVNKEEATEFIQQSEIQYASHDCPVKDKETNDFHGYCAGYGKASQLLITDAWEEHLALIKEKELMIRLQKISPALIQVIEDKANGSALLQLLKGEVAGLVDFNPGTDSKTQRLSIASVYMQNGSVMFEDTPAVRYLVKQLMKFPYVEHDDIVDAFSQLVLYHFTGSTAGVYTNAFTTKNLIEIPEPKQPYLFYTYAATLSGDKIKAVACKIDYAKDTFTFEKEFVFNGITAISDFEQFCITNIKGRNTLIDCSLDGNLSSMISNINIYFDNINDEDIIKSTQLLKNGFYKQRVLINKACNGIINDVAKLRIDDQAVAKGSNDKLNTVDEGYAGCLRHTIQYYKGLNGIWL